MSIEKTEKEKMLAGELYLATDPELAAMNLKALQLLHEFNHSVPTQLAKQQQIIRSLFGSIGSDFTVRPPFYCDYGCYIEAGDNLYINYDCTILDCNRVTIGDNVLIAPKVQIYTAHHPIDPEVRLIGKELASAVVIGDNVWLGGGVIICPGVRIGNDVTVGAGSVVAKNIPDGVVAAGNPCRIIRKL